MRQFAAGLLYLALGLGCVTTIKHEAGLDPLDEVRIQRAQATLDSTVFFDSATMTGSGFFVAPNVIMTAAHVAVEMWESPRVHTRDGRECQFESAEVMKDLDVGVVFVSGCEDQSVLQLGPGGREGQSCWAAGSPPDARWSITQGSVVDADTVLAGIGPVLILDTPVHSGMSGGPVVDSAGRVIGLTSRMVSPDGGRNWGGRTFAISVDVWRSWLSRRQLH